MFKEVLRMVQFNGENKGHSSCERDEKQSRRLPGRKAIFAASLLLVAGQVLAADGWKGDGSGKIESIQPEVYRVGAGGEYPTFVETSNIVSADCGGTTWVIKSDLDQDKRLYSAALTALASGYGVKLYQWSCYSIGGSYYPRIGGIQVIK